MRIGKDQCQSRREWISGGFQAIIQLQRGRDAAGPVDREIGHTIGKELMRGLAIRPRSAPRAALNAAERGPAVRDGTGRDRWHLLRQ